MVVHLSAVGPVAIALIAVAALLVFGPKKLPELGRAVGVTLREFKKGTQGLIEDDDINVIEQKKPQIEQNTVQSEDKKEQENVK